MDSKSVFYQTMSLLILITVLGCSGGNMLVRQDEFPQNGTMIIQYFGPNSNNTQGMEEEIYYKQRYFSKPINLIQKRIKNVYEKKYVFNASQERVWIAVKNVSAKFETEGEHPTELIDEKNFTVKNVSNEMNLNYSVLSDVFVIKVISISEMQSGVIITRKIMELDKAIRAAHAITSSGLIESWVLTQIKDEIGKDSSSF